MNTYVSQCSHGHEYESSAVQPTCIRVLANTSLRVFQWQLFTYIQANSPANFTRMRSFCAGRVFIQPEVNYP